ncbi:MAG: hypothetical protein OEZ38_11285, partial [Gammaproteobacteria bacterium]|nr:hypothetical protein [Gammaproteobacteria bacterium]
NAGTDQVVNENSLVNLDGTLSSDLEDGLPSSYLWQQTSGTPVTLTGPGTATPSFTTPEVTIDGDTLSFQLTVSDSQGLQATDNVVITVNNLDNPPIALITDASGTVISAIANNTQVTLYGNFSSDPDGNITSYSWSQAAGPTIINPGIGNTNQFSFTTPDSPGSTVDIQLMVTGNEPAVSNTAIVSLTLANLPPVVDAGIPQTFLEGETIYLHGLVTDPNNDIASMQWRQINCATTCISLPINDQEYINFTLPPISPAESGMVLDFELVATDSNGLFATATTSITLIDNGITTTYPETAISFYSNNSEEMAISLDSTDPANTATFNLIQPFSPDVITDTSDRPASFPYDLVDLEVITSNPGDTVEIILYYPEPIADGFDLYQYIDTNGWVDNSGSRDFDNLTYTVNGWAETSEQAQFSADRTQISIRVTDGGPGDADGLANGIISYINSGIGSAPANNHKQAGATGSISPVILLLMAWAYFICRARHNTGSPAG